MKAIWMTVAIALSLSTVACGGAEGKCKSTCKDQSECEGGPSEEDCEKSCEDSAADAEEADCKSEYGDIVSCGKKNFDCDPAKMFGECEDEVEAYSKCIE